jgi:energy-coupling factor transporter ATP-binding protein EcfA2
VPIIHAVVECAAPDSFRVRQVAGMFDLPPAAGTRSAFDVEVPSPNEDWAIGVIVGPSGSGKTTVARAAFGDRLVERWDWDAQQSILDGFPKNMGIGQITGLLSAVGFSSPPAWLRPFALLSNGEQFRVNLARTLAEMPELAVVDEFTSVVDRTVARIGSSAIAKAVRRAAQRFVAVTCHYDVLPWLEPDWVLDMADGSLCQYSMNGSADPAVPLPENARRLRRPNIDLRIIRCDCSAWRVFRRHHYLSADLNRSAQCFVGLVDQRPAVFVAALPFPHPARPGWREHRCVCLPDFQGLGIGNAMSEFVASLYATTGRPYTSVTSHPAMIRHRARSGLWRMNRPPSRVVGGGRTAGSGRRLAGMDRTLSWRRLTASFEFIGAARRGVAVQFGIVKR